MILEQKNIDPKTDLIVYGTLGKYFSTDPEVDSAYLTCYYYYFSDLLDVKNCDFKFVKALRHFEHKFESGVFRRYSSAGQNKNKAVEEAKFNNPKNLSRDNTLPIIIACGRFNCWLVVERFINNVVRRFSFFQNTHTCKGVKKLVPDLATPDHWATFIRAYVESISLPLLNKICLYVILNALDVFSILQTLLYVIGSYIKPNDTGSELNIFSACVQRKLVMPTLLGLVANFIYFKFVKYPTELPTVGRYGDKAFIARVENFFSKGRRHRIMPKLDELVVELDKKFNF